MKKDNNIAIKIENLSKTFYLYQDAKFTLRSLFTSFFKQGKTKEFKALNNINLEIKKGEFVGLIGKNGSGKSTLLKLIAGIYNPDKGGKIKVNGKIIPFLELGVGFNPELSGKENIYLNGTILGMTKKFLDSKFNEIVEFAELHEFIETPVKNYSSGMIVRLAFSIAIQADGDIYILDEILAVGDENFQRKSKGIINQLKREKKTIIFVSHDTNAIEKLCDKVIFIQDHSINKVGLPVDVVYEYRESNINKDNTEINNNETIANNQSNKNNRFGSREVEITSIALLDENDRKIETVNIDQKLKVNIRFHNPKNINVYFGVSIVRDDGLYINGNNTKISNFINKSHDTISYEFNSQILLDGKYDFNIAVFKNDDDEPLDFYSRVNKFEIRTYKKQEGTIYLPSNWTEE